jgi:hypothetical protein
MTVWEWLLPWQHYSCGARILMACPGSETVAAEHLG